MGVLECSRSGCDSIMCDIYISSIGYICLDCKTEFKNYLESEQLYPEDESQIMEILDTFMHSRKDKYSGDNKIGIDSFFDKYTNNT